jgi:hypothetical protein
MNEVIYADGIGLGALLDAARKLHDITVTGNLTLGVIYTEGADTPTACLMANGDVGNGQVIAVTVEANPKAVLVGG